jgi:multiple sugar transport system permease protein
MKAALRYLLALFALFCALAPVYWLVGISLKREIDQFAVPPIWFGFQPTFQHFHDTFIVKPFGQYLLNSILVAGISTLLSLLIGIPAAYGLTRMRWKGNSAESIGFWILSNRFLPPIVTIVPLFMMMREVGLLNSPLALIIVYTGFNLPFVIWMMRGFFMEVPIELEEAALMDGDTRMGAFLKVVLPLVQPGIAATAVFCLVVAWNEFLFALVLTQTESSMTLPVGIASQVTQYEIRWGAMSAAGVVAMLPVLAFASFVQKYLVRGLSLGAVKG